MPLSITDFWDLAIESHLLTPQMCQLLASQFAISKPSTPASPKSLAEWLVKQKAISKYQARVLLSGRAGPFLFAGYRVQDPIESGRFAGAFRGVHATTSHPVTMAFLPAELTHNTAQWNTLVEHVRQQIAIRSPFVLRWYDLVETSTHKILIMEATDGASLEEELKNSPVLAPIEASQAIAQSAMGLAEMHQAGCVHGDVRPYNLWLCTNGEVKLLRDLPSASSPAGKGAFDPLAQTLGSRTSSDRFDYLAPEFLLPGKQPECSTDIYALGCTFFEILAGAKPFPGGTSEEKLKRHASEPIRSLTDLDVPPAIAQVVTYMMAKNPSVRIQRAELIGEHLCNLLGAHQSPPPPSLSASAVAFEKALKQGPAGRPVPQRGERMGEPGEPKALVSGGVGTYPRIEASIPDVKSPDAAFLNDGAYRSQRGAPDVSARGTPSGDSTASVPSITLSSSSTIRASTRAGKRSLNWPMVAALAMAFVAIVGGLYYISIRPSSTSLLKVRGEGTAPNAATKSELSTSESKTKRSAEGSQTQVLTSDDGKSLWASPVAGDPAESPLEFQFLPSGAQFVVYVRLADLLAHPEGSKVLKSLGPEFEQAVKTWQQTIQIPFRELESLLIAFQDDPATLRPTIVVRTKDAQSLAGLTKELGDEKTQVNGNIESFTAKGWFFARPTDPDSSVFVMGAKAEVDDIMERKGEAPPPHRWIDRLRMAVDSRRMFCAFVTLHSLETEVLRDGRDWPFVGNIQRLRSALGWFLGDDILAACLSMHLDSSFYVELRLISALKKDRHTIASELRTRLSSLPELVEVYLAQLQSVTYWGNIAFRFPSMLRYLHEQTRVGVDGDQAVVNAHLPAVAAHNLLFGSTLAVASSPGALSSASPVASAAKGMKEILAQPLSIDIPQQDLVFAVGDLENLVNDDVRGMAAPFKIKIMGNDLKEAGITQNQKVVDFKQQNTALSEILTALVKKANPNPNAATPAELEKELVWSIGNDPENSSRQIVFITTRSAALRDGHKLAPAFSQK